MVGTAAVLGLAMAARWVRVYRSFARPGPGLASKHAVPPERNFPLPVVIAHGLLAVTTIVLVLVTTLGGSLCPEMTAPLERTAPLEMTAPPGAAAHEGVPWPVRRSPHGERHNMAPAGRYSMKAVS